MAGIILQLSLPAGCLAPAVLTCTPISKQDLQMPHGTKERETIILWAWTLLPNCRKQENKQTWRPGKHSPDPRPSEPGAGWVPAQQRRCWLPSDEPVFLHVSLGLPAPPKPVQLQTLFSFSPSCDCADLLPEHLSSACPKLPQQQTAVPAAPDTPATCCTLLTNLPVEAERGKQVGFFSRSGCERRTGEHGQEPLGWARPGVARGAQPNPIPGQGPPVRLWGWAA